jgi:oxygen-independent coproporphyrinogen-3 oxidase
MKHRYALEPPAPADLASHPQVASLYIHIPFCLRKCPYCDFFSVPYDESWAFAYTGALCKELQLKSAVAGVMRTIYIGGGTPSLLPDRCFRQIISCLNDYFDIPPETEISVEANPGTLSEGKIDLLVSLGVNRLSIGIQSLNGKELSTLGRMHTGDDAIRCLDVMRRSGLPNISVDLMYGIPGQSVYSWHSTISSLIEHKPNHISAYELTFEEGTLLPLTTEKPREDLILSMYDSAVDMLAVNGYEQYEISNFAQPGFRCCHNLNYWERGEYIGTGAGAHSFICERRSVNVVSVDDYIEQLDSNVLPERESVTISSEGRLREFLFLGLRKTEGISIREATTLGLDVIGAGREMVDEGFLEFRDDRCRLTRKGIVLSNAVVVRLFQPLGL